MNNTMEARFAVFIFIESSVESSLTEIDKSNLPDSDEDNKQSSEISQLKISQNSINLGMCN